MTFGELFCAALNENFEHLGQCGIIKVISKDPDEIFFLNVKHDSIVFHIGPIVETPLSIITLKNNLLADIVNERNNYDNRILSFSSRLHIAGDILFGHSVLDSIKTPKKSVSDLLERAKKRAEAAPVNAIEYVDGLDPSIISALVLELKPVIIKGMLDDWMVSTWSPDSLKARLGETKIASYFHGNLGDFIDAMMTAKKPNSRPLIYTGGVGLPGALWKYFPTPVAIRGQALGFPQLWLGSAGDLERVTGLHCDCVHGFLCQIFGNKIIKLYSPDQEDFLYPSKAFNQYRRCRVEFPNLDLTKYPLFQHAISLDVTLTPGQVLFIPAGWFHSVFSSKPVMSISFPIDENGVLSNT